MPWTRPDPPEWLDRLNAHGAAVGGAEHLVSLDPEDLLDAARASTGLDDFGGESWRAPLRRARRRAAQRGAAHGRRPGRGAHRAAARAPPTPAARRGVERATRRSSTSRSPNRSSWSGPAGRGPRSSTSCSRSIPRTGCRSPGSCCTPARRSDPTPPTARRAGHEVHAFWADLQPAVRDDAPQRRRRTERVHLRHDARVPLRPMGLARTRCRRTRPTSSAPTRPRRTGTTAGCSRPCKPRPAPARWVLKAPSHLGQLRTLFAVYPDARVIQIHRDPLKTVPSTISLMGTIRSMRCERVDVDALAPWVSLGYAPHARRHDGRPRVR